MFRNACVRIDDCNANNILSEMKCQIACTDKWFDNCVFDAMTLCMCACVCDRHMTPPLIMKPIRNFYPTS